MKKVTTFIFFVLFTMFVLQIAARQNPYRKNPKLSQPSIADSLSRIYYYKGIKSIRDKNNASKAARQLEEALRILPQSQAYLKDLITLYYMAGEYDKVVSTLNNYRPLLLPYTWDAVQYNVLMAIAHAGREDIAQNRTRQHDYAISYFNEAEKRFDKMKDTLTLSAADTVFLRKWFMSQGVVGLLRVDLGKTGMEEAHGEITAWQLEKAAQYLLKAANYGVDSTLLANYDKLRAYYADISNMPSVLQKTLDENIKVQKHQKRIRKIKSTTEEQKSSEYEVKWLPENIKAIVDTANKYTELMIVTDISGSMAASMQIKDEDTSRFGVVTNLERYLLAKIKASVTIGGITVGEDCQENPVFKYAIGDITRTELKQKVSNLQCNGATPLNAILLKTPNLFTPEKNKKAIFLLTDGMNTCSPAFETCTIAEMLNNKGIDLHVASFILDEGNNSNDYSFFHCLTVPSNGNLWQVGKEIENLSYSIPPPIHYITIPDLFKPECGRKVWACAPPCSPIHEKIE